MIIKDDYKTFHVGVNVFVLKDEKLLLGKRKNVFGAGTWGLIGGHLEPGETMIDAAKREILEETGLEIKDLIFSNLVNNCGQEEHYLQIGFVATEFSGEPYIKEPDRCEELRWFNLNELPKDLFPPHIKQIENYIKKLNFIDD